MQNSQPAKESIMSSHVSSPAKYRFEDRILFVIVPSMLLVILMKAGLDHFHLRPAGAWAVLCAAVASWPFIAYVFCAGFYLADEKDEFQRSLFVQAILWGLGVAACVAVFWFMLGTFIHVPRMNIFSGEILFVAGMVVSGAVNRWRYR
jgi:hypothetical protein